jgi:ABC-type amino acid transport substrate-binding protein
MAVPGVTVRVYDQFTSEVADLQAGRIDLFFYDPFALEQLHKERPEIAFDVAYITPPTADEVARTPALDVFRPFMSGWYLAPEAEALQAAFDKVIRDFYADGFLAQTIAKWGGDPDEMLRPAPYFAGQRIGVDRPEGWEPPSIAR